MALNIKKITEFILLLSFLTLPSYAKDMRFVQISEAKYCAIKNNNLLDKVIQDVNKQKNIDFVIFTGDNIEKPNKENLSAFVSATKKLKVPCYVVIGDKDVNKHKDLSKKQYAKYLKRHMRKYRQDSPNYVFEKHGVIFMIVDGSKDVIPSTNGFYKDDVLEWVDANLDLYSKKTIIIFQHFPLIPPDNKESYITYKPEKYLEILKKHKNVKAVISGHFGVDKEITADGILHISSDSFPKYRIIDILDYDTKNPTIWAETKVVK